MAPDRREVEINGLLYIFITTIPSDRRRDFEWKLVVPEMEGWDIDENPDFFNGRQGERVYMNRGAAAGYLKGFNCDSALLLDQIYSNTPLLSPRLRYYKAAGLGNFLLKGLIREADMKEKLITLIPGPDRQWHINPEAVINWYKRNGFAYSSTYEMTRYPNSSITSIQKKSVLKPPAGVPLTTLQS